MIIGLGVNKLTLYILEFTIAFQVFWAIYMLRFKIKNEEGENISNKKIVNQGRKRTEQINKNTSPKKVNNFKIDKNSIRHDLKNNEVLNQKEIISVKKTHNIYRHLTNQIITDPKNELLKKDNGYIDFDEKDISEMLGEKLDNHFAVKNDFDEDFNNLTNRTSSSKREKSFDINRQPEKKFVESQIIDIRRFSPDYAQTAVKNRCKNTTYNKRLTYGVTFQETKKYKTRKTSVENIKNYATNYKQDGFYLDRGNCNQKRNFGVTPIRGLDTQNQTIKGTQNLPYKTKVKKLQIKKEVYEYNIVNEKGVCNKDLNTAYPTNYVNKCYEEYHMDEEKITKFYN